MCQVRHIKDPLKLLYVTQAFCHSLVSVFPVFQLSASNSAQSRDLNSLSAVQLTAPPFLPALSAFWLSLHQFIQYWVMLAFPTFLLFCLNVLNVSLNHHLHVIFIFIYVMYFFFFFLLQRLCLHAYEKSIESIVLGVF